MNATAPCVVNVMSTKLITLYLDSREIRQPEKFHTRNFPPDGSTFQQISLDERLAVTVPPFGYLNIQFFQQVKCHPDVEQVPGIKHYFFALG